MIYVSAGHYAASKGAKFEDKFNEFDEALLWQKSIVRRLGNLGMSVIPGRLPAKIEYINDYISALAGNHIAVEIHFNSAVNPYGIHVGRGSETLYCPGSKTGKPIAFAVQNKLKNVFGPDRGIKEGYYQMNPKKGPDAFLSRTKCPAIIIEPGFVQNYEKIAEGREAGCAVIARALSNYLGE